MKVEYFTVFESKKNICSSKQSVIHFIQSHDNLSISRGNKIKFDNFEVAFKLEVGEIVNESQRFIHIILETGENFSPTNIDELKNYESLLREIRKLMGVISEGSTQVLWDDISKYYSTLSYPLIHDVENLMRKLITKFMLKNIGVSWMKTTVPNKLEDKSRVTPSDSQNDYLYELDFIQLSDFLFYTYNNMDASDLIEKVKSANSLDETTLKELKSIVPKSNWERYFSEAVECDEAFLRKNWEKLYKLRCKIAHNKSFSSSDYTNTVDLANRIRPILESSIEKLDQLTLSDAERDSVLESMASNIDEVLGSYISEWNRFEKILLEIFEARRDVLGSHMPNARVTIRSLIKAFYAENLINVFTAGKIDDCFMVRNKVVHNPNDISVNDVKDALGQLIAMKESLVERFKIKAHI